MLHFNHGSKQEANEGNAECCRRCGLHRCANYRRYRRRNPQHPHTSLRDINRQPLRLRFQRLLDQTANLGFPDWCVISPGESEEDAEAREAYESLARHRKARRKKKLIMAGTAAGVFCSSSSHCLFCLCARADRARTPLLCQALRSVTRGEFSDSVSASGSIKPRVVHRGNPEVDGIIQDVQVPEGTYVHKGDKLFTIKNDELDKAVRGASQQVKAAENEVSKARSALASASQRCPGGGRGTDKKQTLRLLPRLWKRQRQIWRAPRLRLRRLAPLTTTQLPRGR